MPQSYNTELTSVATIYSELIHARISPSTLATYIEENPEYPGLLSLSDTYEHFNIPCNAYRVSPEALEQIKPPFIAYLDVPSTGKDFVVISALDDQQVTYIHKNAKPRTAPKTEFLKHFQEIVFIAEPHKTSGEPGFEKKIKEARLQTLKQRILTGTGILMVVLLYLNGILDGNTWIFSALFLLHLCGLITAILLLTYQVNKENEFVQKVCKANEKKSCDMVLNSGGSTIAGITWSEIGFFYFATATGWLLIPGLPLTAKIPYFAATGLAAGCYIPYSIYYQWRVVKKWCPLCLTVQATLAAELILIAFIYRLGTATYDAHVFASLLFCILAPITAWYTAKPLLGKIKDPHEYKAAYRRLLNNPVVFNSLLPRQAKAPSGWQQMGIDLGNPKGKITIISVCSPYCGHCANAHQQFSEMIKVNHQLNVKLIFRTPARSGDKSMIAAAQLLALSKLGNAETNRKLIEDWYSSENKPQFSLSGYQTVTVTSQIEQELQEMSTWCKAADITFTPTIYINDNRLPDGYFIDELKSILH